MSSDLVVAGNLTLGRAEPVAGTVVIRRGAIAAVEEGRADATADLRWEDGVIAPGFVDLQMNGGFGESFSDPTADVGRVARALVRFGVTAFLPTLVSDAPDRYRACLPGLAPRPVPGGAELLGVHLEGPYLSPTYRGAHRAEVLRLPDPAELAEWIASGVVRLVTLAPELPGALDAIRTLTRAGIVVSLGHSGADEEIAAAGLEAGASMGSHLFNAMSPFSHRSPGLPNALLARPAVVSVIADGAHVVPSAVAVAVRAKSVQRVALITDATAALGMPSGSYRLGDLAVHSDGETVRLPDGRLAGSALSMDRAVRNVGRWLPELGRGAVIRMATVTPAGILPEARLRKGRIAVGYDADLVALDPAGEIRATIIRGEVAYVAGDG